MTIEFVNRLQRLDFKSLPKTYIFKCGYDSQVFEPELYGFLEICYPINLHNTVHKRQAEYLAGRYAAKHALSYLGIEKFDISSNEDRAPIWPDNIIGSISHTSTRAICAVTRCKYAKFLGVDLENWIHGKVIEEIDRTILSRSERRMLAGLPCSYERAFTLAYSAKESLFKALYPSVGRYFEFSDVKITKVATKDKSFELILSRDLSEVHRSGICYKGVYLTSKREILTCISQLVV